MDSTSLTPIGVVVEGSTMAQKVISMDAKLSAVFARSLSAAGRPNVSAVCAELGISRQSYYKYRRRFAAEGLAGLQERSRRPRFSPSRTPAVVEDAIVRARKELAEEGWDNGAVSIYYRLLADQAGCTVEEGPPLAVPSARTVHRVLVRLGLVVSDPAKRPRSSLRRFEFPATDDCWQIDATEVELQPATATAAPLKAVVFQVLDDHSRYEVASLAWPGEDGAGAWTVMTTAIARYGLPGLVLSDNGAAFSGARRGAVVAFEANLRALGTSPITSRPYHPQTCGKNERVHRTWKQWMRRRDLHPATLAELQAALDTWRPAYNNRPHQALAGATPAQRRAAGMRTSPRPSTNPAAAGVTTSVTRSAVTGRGTIYVAGCTIHLGAAWIGRTITCIRTGTDLVCLDGDQLVRTLTLHPGATYIGNGQPRGGRRQHRINDTLPPTP